MPPTDDACPGSFTEPEAWSDGDTRSMVLCQVCVTWLPAPSDTFSAASNVVPGHHRFSPQFDGQGFGSGGVTVPGDDSAAYPYCRRS